MKCCWTALLLSSCVLLGLPAALPAQQGGETEPHVLLPGGLDRASAQELLKRKLRRNQDLQQTKDLVQDVLKNPGKYGLTEQDLKRLLEEAAKNGGSIDPSQIDPKAFDPGKIDPSDPALKGLIDKLDPGSLTPEQKDSLSRIKEEWEKRPSRPPVDVKPPTDPGLKPVPPPPPPGPRPEFTPLQQLPPSQPPRVKEPPSWFTTQMKKMTSRGGDGTTSAPSGLGDSEWSKRMRQFSRDHMPRFRSDAATKSLSGPNIRSPRVKSPSMPDVSVPRGGVGGGGGGVSGAADAASGAGTIFLMLTFAVLFAVAAWLIYRVLQQKKGEEGGPLTLGAWPVQPGQVRTRADLVRAFEYLALLLLGLPARTKHHLALGARLGTAPPETTDRRQAAGELTRLYEQARYTPPEEELSAADAEAARRDLALLARVGVS